MLLSRKKYLCFSKVLREDKFFLVLCGYVILLYFICYRCLMKFFSFFMNFKLRKYCDKSRFRNIFVNFFLFYFKVNK